MTKMTKKVALRVALEALNLVGEQMEVQAEWSMDDVKAKLSEMIASLDKKPTTKSTKNQQENEYIKSQMLDLLGRAKPMRATDVANALGLSSGQKASVLLNALAKDGLVAKVKGEKGATLFTLPDPVEDEE